MKEEYILKACISQGKMNVVVVWLQGFIERELMTVLEVSLLEISGIYWCMSLSSFTCGYDFLMQDARLWIVVFSFMLWGR